MGMAKYNDVAYFQMLDSILQHGTGAVISAIPLVGRNQVGDIMHDKQVAWIGLQHLGRIGQLRILGLT